MPQCGMAVAVTLYSPPEPVPVAKLRSCSLLAYCTAVVCPSQDATAHRIAVTSLTTDPDRVLGSGAHLNDVPVKAQPLEQPDLILKLLQVGPPCVIQDFDGHVLAPVLEATVNLQHCMTDSVRELHCQVEA